MKSSLTSRILSFIKLGFYLLKIFFQLMYGAWRISKFKCAPVTIFGGTHLTPESIYIKKARELSGMLAQIGIPVLTGGGPGIMEAANCGAEDMKKSIVSTMGITVRGLDRESGLNKCAQNNIVLDHFFARKWLLVNYSIGFAIFPGGFGTLDELAELLTLIQTKMRAKAPIVLIGKDYWAPLIDWINNSALKNNLISNADLDLFKVTDDVEEALSLLRAHCHNKPFSFFPLPANNKK